MMKDFFGQEIPVLAGSAYDKVCIAVEGGEIGAYLSNCKYQSIEPGDKNFPPMINFSQMLKGLIRYCEEHPDKEEVVANDFIAELQTCPHIYALVTLIEMLAHLVLYIGKKSFFTDDLIMSMANLIEKNADKLEDVVLLGANHNNIRKKAEFADKYVYKIYGIHLVPPKKTKA